MAVCRLFLGFLLLLPEGAEGNFFVFCRITSANACFFIIFWQTHHIFFTSFSAALERCRKVKVLFGPSLFIRVGIVGIKSYFVHKKSIYAEKFVYFRRAESSNWRVAGESPRRLNKSRTKGFRWKYFRKSYFFSCNISLSMLQGAHENCKRGGIRLGGSDIKHTASFGFQRFAEFNI